MSVADISEHLHVIIGFGVDAVGGTSYFVLNDAVRGQLDNVTYKLAPDTVFVDVTDHVSAITIERGRDRELDEYGTGTAAVVFNDNDRTFDPAYSGSPYFGELVPMKSVEIRWSGIELFTGWIDDWAVTYEPGDNLSRVTATCVDEFGVLANQDLDTIAAAFSGDTSGARVERVLDLAEVDYVGGREIDTGSSILGATTYGSNALAYLQEVTRAEAGYFFVTADGVLTFKGRTSILNIEPDPGGIVSDDRNAGIPYRNIVQRSSTDLLYTRVTGQTETVGTPLTATNTTAANDYRIRTLPLGSLMTSSDVQTQNLLNYYLNRFSAIDLRFNLATFNVAALSEAQVRDIVNYELTDIVTVERSPMGIGSTISRRCIVDGIRHRIGPGVWDCDLAFANIGTRVFLQLDHSVFGELDAYRLAF